MLTEYVWLVETTVEPEWEQSFNSWYDEIHLNEVAAWPGWLRGARFVSRTEADADEATGSRRYFAIYELNGPEAMTEEFRSTAPGEGIRSWGSFTGHLKSRGQLLKRIKESEAAH